MKILTTALKTLEFVAMPHPPRFCVFVYKPSYITDIHIIKYSNYKSKVAIDLTLHKSKQKEDSS